MRATRIRHIRGDGRGAIALVVDPIEQYEWRSPSRSNFRGRHIKSSARGWAARSSAPIDGSSASKRTLSAA
jgi:hypothetical protein